MNNRKNYLGLAILMFAALPSFAQTNEPKPENHFQLNAQLRPKFELRDGVFQTLSKDQKPAALISNRTRLTANHFYKDLLETKISLQNVAIWGQAPMNQGVENSGNNFAIYEAWAKMKLNPNWSMKLGRQVISLDDERFYGESDWSQGPRAHDALNFGYKKAETEFGAWLAYNQNYKTL